MITHKTPKLDLHGEEVAVVFALVNEFINDNYKMGNEEILIIHGKSTNILTREVHNILKEHPLVKTYHLDNWNVGQTIVNLKLNLSVNERQ